MFYIDLCDPEILPEQAATMSNKDSIADTKNMFICLVQYGDSNAAEFMKKQSQKSLKKLFYMVIDFLHINPFFLPY